MLYTVVSIALDLLTISVMVSEISDVLHSGPTVIIINQFYRYKQDFGDVDMVDGATYVFGYIWWLS